MTPTITSPKSYTLNFNNPFFHPHDGHNADAGGIIASTGFFINEGATEYFFDDQWHHIALKMLNTLEWNHMQLVVDGLKIKKQNIFIHFHHGFIIIKLR